jgi:hypothetical protein
MAKDHGIFWTGEELTKPRMFLRDIPQELLTDLMQFRPGDIVRHAP